MGGRASPFRPQLVRPELRNTTELIARCARLVDRIASLAPQLPAHDLDRVRREIGELHRIVLEVLEPSRAPISRSRARSPGRA